MSSIQEEFQWIIDTHNYQWPIDKSDRFAVWYGPDNGSYNLLFTFGAMPGYHSVHVYKKIKGSERPVYVYCKIGALRTDRIV